MRYIGNDVISLQTAAPPGDLSTDYQAFEGSSKINTNLDRLKYVVA